VAFVEWIIFTVIVGASPILLDLLLRRTTASFALDGFLARGDLLVVGALLAGTAFGRICMSRPKWWPPLVSGLLGFGCFVVVFLAIFLYLVRWGGIYVPLTDAQLAEYVKWLVLASVANSSIVMTVAVEA